MPETNTYTLGSAMSTIFLDGTAFRDGNEFHVHTPRGVRRFKLMQESGPQPNWPYTMTVPELFEQTSVWIDAKGGEYPVARMTLDYVANVMRFISQNHGWMYKQANVNALSGTPLYRALRRRLLDAIEFPTNEALRPTWIGPATYDDDDVDEV
jgi:hypothetical protein